MRVDGWEKRLNGLVEEYRHVPFKYGSHDCAIFAATVIDAIAPLKVRLAFAGKYTGKVGAVRTIRKIGGSDLKAATTALLECEPVPPQYAQRGDPMVYVVEGVQHLAVCLGAQAALPVESGLQFIPAGDCECCWRI